MRAENRSPVPRSRPCRSDEDNARPEKGGVVGPAAREMVCGPCRKPIRPHHSVGGPLRPMEQANVAVEGNQASKLTDENPGRRHHRLRLHRA
ncbi:hypothetical protein NDU88_004917 [Pleurodeles waltl]|uniref:Uncharacterized protein n=1 Tax=Pleurodeles waltl TaxID=8319 RepID=A0AAV7WTA1_PLEWA|nr:hypothetical protein NDU88_004917 [Pleurodeles waltl]